MRKMVIGLASRSGSSLITISTLGTVLSIYLTDRLSLKILKDQKPNMLYNYLLIALRNLKKNITLSLINIFGLAIGISVALLILNYVANEYSYDKFHANADNIYRVESNFHEGKVLTDDWPTASFGYGPAMKANIPGIKDYVRIALHQINQVVKFENIRFILKIQLFRI